MHNEVKPYSSEGSKKEQVEQMFDNVAGNYDFLNRLLSVGVDIGWRKHLIKKMKVYQPNLVLDMATGTADLAIMAAKKMPETKFIGLDLSANMIAVGDNKIKSAGLVDRVNLHVGDSEDIKYSSDHFDSAMVAFGVRNYQDLDKGLSELYRVLKKGAPILILEFSKPTIFPVKQVFNLYFKWVVPSLGKLFSKDQRAYTYLYDSVQSFPAYDDFTKRMDSAGFRNTTWEALSFGICCLYIGVK